MPLSLDQIRASLRQLSGHDSVSLPDNDTGSPPNMIIGANTFINRAWWNFLNVMDIREKEATSSISTVASQSQYTFPVTSEAVRLISVLNPDTQVYIPLIPWDLKTYNKNISLNSFDEDIPVYFVRDGANYFLVPTPDDVYTLKFDHLALLDDLTLLGPTGPREIGEIILYGSAWRVFSDVNSNTAKTTFYMGMEANLLNKYVPVKQKEEDSYQVAGISYIGRDYDQE